MQSYMPIYYDYVDLPPNLNMMDPYTSYNPSLDVKRQADTIRAIFENTEFPLFYRTYQMFRYIQTVLEKYKLVKSNGTTLPTRTAFHFEMIRKPYLAKIREYREKQVEYDLKEFKIRFMDPLLNTVEALLLHLDRT